MRQVYFVLILALLVACGDNHKSKNDFDPYVWADSDMLIEDFAEETTMQNEETEVSIPFEMKNGLKYIPVKINGGPTFDMIFDTGCSGTLISIKEVQYLIQAGLLTQEDYRGNTHSSIADGSIVENMVFNLKELIIGNKIRCTDVTATVSKNIQAPMLLGNDVFDRVQSLTIDNEKQEVIFKLR